MTADTLHEIALLLAYQTMTYEDFFLSQSLMGAQIGYNVNYYNSKFGDYYLRRDGFVFLDSVLDDVRNRKDIAKYILYVTDKDLRKLPVDFTGFMLTRS